MRKEMEEVPNGGRGTRWLLETSEGISQRNNGRAAVGVKVSGWKTEI